MKESKRLNILDKYKKNISPKAQKALVLISKLAFEKKINAYLIGGIVRDIILQKNGFDIDITIETNAIEFAKSLKKEYENCHIKEIHNDFKTAKVTFDIEKTTIEIDLASTRTETYKTPASLPVVEKIACSIKDDASRRDFTINTLAMSLSQEKLGDLIDPLKGYQDLAKKELKILHNKSFIDDPTRIIRMLKFSIRFGFSYEKTTNKLMDKAINSGKFDNLGTERIKLELKQTFNLNYAQTFDRLIEEGIYKLVNTKIKPLFKGKKIKETIDAFKINKENVWLVYLSLLLVNLNIKEIKKTSASLNLNNFEKKVLQDAKWLFENQKNLNQNLCSNYEIYRFFKGKEKEAIVAFGCQNMLIAKKYTDELSKIKIQTKGDDLLKLGFSQGKEIGVILEKLLEEKLNGKIKNLADEKNYLLSFTKEK